MQSKKLSPRESEVLGLLLSGFTVTAIAKKLQLAVTSISTVFRNLRNKLGLWELVDLVRYAVSTGLITLDINYIRLPLSEQEKIVYKLFKQGLKVKDIAIQLRVSTSTISDSLKMVSAKRGKYILTDLDKCIFKGVILGKSYKKLAEEHGYSSNIIHKRLKIIYRQLGLATHVDCIKFGIISNLISINFDSENKEI